MKKYIILAVTSVFVVLIDQLTKWKIAASMNLYDRSPIIDGYFDLRYVHNKGAAFGLLSSAPDNFRAPFFFVISIIALIVIILFLRKVEEENQLFVFSLSFIFGGAVGNFIDRIVHGHVIDFLDFHLSSPDFMVTFLLKMFGTTHWPAFNVADAAIVVGVGLMIIDMFREFLREKREAA